MCKNFKFGQYEISITINKEKVVINKFIMSTALLKKLWLTQFIAKQIIKIIILVAILSLH